MHSSSLSALLVTTYFFFFVFICWLSAVQERVTGYSQLVNSFCLPRCQLGMCNYSRWSWKISQHCTIKIIKKLLPICRSRIENPHLGYCINPKKSESGKTVLSSSMANFFMEFKYYTTLHIWRLYTHAYCADR